MRIQASQIILKDVRLYGFHGVLPQERIVGTYFILNIRVQTDFSLAMTADELDGTLSYASVFDIVRAEMAVPSALLEHVAGRICHAIFDRFPQAEAIDIELLKENPPMGADCKGAGVRLLVSRSDVETTDRK